MTTIAYSDLELRSREILRARYVFSSALPRNAPVSELLRQGVDCAQAAAWIYGPWLEVPDYTGSIYTWASRTGRLIAVKDRRPGDLLLRKPGWFGQAIGHVGMVLADTDIVRQARSSHSTPNCGDFPVSSTRWQTAVWISEVSAVPVQPLVDLVAVAKAMTAFKQAVTAQPLQLFASGPAVTVVQDKLHIPQTRVYDYQTVAAVSAFQTFWNAHHRNDQPALAVDGVVGPVTWGALFGEFA